MFDKGQYDGGCYDILYEWIGGEAVFFFGSVRVESESWFELMEYQDKDFIDCVNERQVATRQG